MRIRVEETVVQELHQVGVQQRRLQEKRRETGEEVCGQFLCRSCELQTGKAHEKFHRVVVGLIVKQVLIRSTSYDSNTRQRPINTNIGNF